jgi:three-Cys-motif partner protein
MPREGFMVANSFFDEKRSWSRIKDEVLKAYLPPYLAKVSRTRKPIIVADCFAGKGAFDDGEPGSPLIIIGAITDQIATYPLSEIKAVLIEKKYVQYLRRNVPDRGWVHILEGDYENRMEYFIEQYDPRGQNLLLYVDPYGIKSILFSHFRRVKSKGFNSVELLLNLNSFGFLREACRLSNVSVDEEEQPAQYESDVNSPERLDEIAGGSYWRDIIDRKYSGEISMAQAEEEFVAEYGHRLRKVFRYVVNIPVKVKLGNIPKYRIVFGTDHEDGLLLMVDDMCKRWNAFREEARSNQSPLFEFDFPDQSKLHDCWNVKEKIVSMIDDEVELKALLVSLVGIYGISFSTSDYKEHLKEMIGDQIDVRRDPESTATGRKSSSWDHMKKDLTITISRRQQWQPSLL